MAPTLTDTVTVQPSSPDSMNTTVRRPLRVAVIGCGKISQELHLPILAGHEHVQLNALVDRDVSRATSFAKSYDVPTVLGDADSLTSAAIDGVIVATPPFHHAPCCIELMKRGIHVLVEKPMATNYADAAEMVRVAEQSGVVLSVGFFRRLMPSVRLLKALIDGKTFGKPLSFEVEGGGFYNWESATLTNMRKDWAGGGVLIDFGSHMVDLLHYLFQGPGEVLEMLEYRDNSLGGIESDCEISLRARHEGTPINGRMELARTRDLGNFIRVHCENASLEYSTTERYQVRVIPLDSNVSDPVEQRNRSFFLNARWEGQTEDRWYETVRQEIDDWLNAIWSQSQPFLSGSSALPTVKLVEDCYSRPQPMHEPWVTEKVTRLSPTFTGVNGNQPRRRVLITGASGFIGSRLAEALTLRGDWEVRALVHNPGNASRLARLPVELIQADLGTQEDAERLVSGCDAVVHCAIGTDWGSRQRIFDVTVGGTQRLVSASMRANVRRFVHLSTIAVHRTDLKGTLDESTPLDPEKGNDYAESKAEAERVMKRAADKGLSAVILRPGCVYGPFSRIFTIRPIRAIAHGTLRWIPSPDSPSNILYVDNLVEAIIRSMEASDNIERGDVFTISDGDDITWRDFFGFFAQEIGRQIPHEVLEPVSDNSRHTNSFVGSVASWIDAPRSILMSAEFRSFGRRVLMTDPIGYLPRQLLERFPSFERRLKSVLKVDDLPVYHRDPPAKEYPVVEMGSSPFLIRIEKAKEVLGYRRVVDRELGMKLTLDWVRHARIV